MKIGMITQWYDPEGSSAALPGVISRSLARRGHDVEVLTGFPNYPSGQIAPGYSVRPYHHETMRGVSVHRAPLWANHDQSGPRRALNYFSFAGGATAVGLTRFPTTDANLVHLTPATAALPALALKATRRTPFVVHVQDLWPDSVLHSALLTRGSSGAAWALHRMCDRIYEAADSIAVTSPGMAAAIAERGVPASKIHFVPNWSDEASFAPREKPESLVARHGLGGSFVVMYAGNFGEYQRLELLIDAAAALRHRSDVKFVIMGSGVLESRLHDRVTAEGLTNVRLLPPQPFERMGEFMALADVHYIGLEDLPLFERTIPSKVQATMCAAGAIVSAIGGDAARAIKAAGGIALEDVTASALASAIDILCDDDGERLRTMKQAARSYYLNTFSEERASGSLLKLLGDAKSRSAL